MKTLKNLLIVSTLLFITNTTFAKIWRVNNNLGISTNFTTLQQANDDVLVLNGDTLHVEGSNLGYGGLNLSKRLIVIGPGYFLGSNPETQAFTVTAKISSTVNFILGSSGSFIQGMDFRNSTIGINASNISIIRNLDIGTTFLGYNATTGASSNVSNIIISQNFSMGNIGNATNPIVSNVLITNNFIKGSIIFQPNTTALIQNNVLDPTINLGPSGTVLNTQNCLYANNILVTGVISSAASHNNNTYSNNISNSTQFTPSGSNSGSNNQTNVSMASVFVGPLNPTTDGNWALLNPGPGKNTAQGGGDCGIFGGSSPYVLSGMPAIPSVYFYSLPATGSNTNPLNISSKAKSRN